ncbi:MAG: GreA/GreB family elongation factor [Kofleriaceae bacterium]|nr:GreA/GreB family elongation factor [Kofleriaceae bacterium]MBE7454947.1 GreA/GreB family elongation factor [Kofleriaceae bacterium]MCL4225103.1 GreA/GreB family elongation factor [Myxococcales bacterium]
MMDKLQMVSQLREHLLSSARVARSARDAAALEAREGATPAERREDARTAIEQGGLVRGQDRRLREAEAAVEALAGFAPPPWSARSPIHVGAVVEVEDEDTGEGRTVFLAPVGAGITLEGPGGDGVFSVITPASPLGRAIIGRRQGDAVDVTIDGELRSYAITWVA